nr:MAG TPA: hypothetical protein [Caudoviricetes sp.]DAS39231.1 MAG TPA: hypothetical protein [Bacteriophage sp.]
MQEKHPARSLRKGYCQCYAHNHQPPTARMCAAVLQKIRGVPKKHSAEIGVSRDCAMTRRADRC